MLVSVLFNLLEGVGGIEEKQVLEQARQGSFLAKLCAYRVATTQVVTFSHFAQRCCGQAVEASVELEWGSLGWKWRVSRGFMVQFLDSTSLTAEGRGVWQGAGLASDATPGFLASGELPGQERTLWMQGQ